MAAHRRGSRKSTLLSRNGSRRVEQVRFSLACRTRWRGREIAQDPTVRKTGGVPLPENRTPTLRKTGGKENRHQESREKRVNQKEVEFLRRVEGGLPRKLRRKTLYPLMMMNCTPRCLCMAPLWRSCALRSGRRTEAPRCVSRTSAG